MKSGKRLLKILATLGIVVAAALLFGWYKFFHEVDQPDWITEHREVRCSDFDRASLRPFLAKPPGVVG